MVRNDNDEVWVPTPLDPDSFNPDCEFPYGLTTEHVRLAMQDFLQFLGVVNGQLHGSGMSLLEAVTMPANFSSIVGEFIISSVPRHCNKLAKNLYHNGHPDLVPAGLYEGNSVQHADQGIEVKASRYGTGWQGHNPEDTWLMVFVFGSSRPVDLRVMARGAVGGLRPFRFRRVLGARLEESDWNFSGRGAESRRTITASVVPSGYDKMAKNWIYWAD